MVKIKWANLALEDLKTIYEYVAQDSPKYVDRLMDKIISRVDVLKTNPQIGRKVPEFGDTLIRELIEGNYRLTYRLDKKDDIGITSTIRQDY